MQHAKRKKRVKPHKLYPLMDDDMAAACSAEGIQQILPQLFQVRLVARLIFKQNAHQLTVGAVGPGPVNQIGQHLLGALVFKPDGQSVKKHLKIAEGHAPVLVVTGGEDDIDVRVGHLHPLRQLHAADLRHPGKPLRRADLSETPTPQPRH